MTTTALALRTIKYTKTPLLRELKRKLRKTPLQVSRVFTKQPYTRHLGRLKVVRRHKSFFGSEGQLTQIKPRLNSNQGRLARYHHREAIRNKLARKIATKTAVGTVVTGAGVYEYHKVRRVKKKR